MYQESKYAKVTKGSEQNSSSYVFAIAIWQGS